MAEIKHNIRKEAASALQEILQGGGYSSIVINQYLKKLDGQIEERDRRLFTGLVYTTLEHLPTIDAGLAVWSSVKLRKMKPWVATCLRMGLAQLMYMDKIPASAAVNETVELIKKSPCRGLAGFVNGVLRGAQRAGFTVPQPDPAKEPIKALSLQYDMPEWIVDLWMKGYGKEVAGVLLERSRGQKPLCCRANPVRVEPAALIARLEEELGEDNIRTSDTVPEAFYVRYSGDMTRWEPYQQGLLTIQDESSMLAAMATGAKPDDRVVDMCAAPGGKSIVMAQMMKNQGQILSRDIHPHRVDLIHKNAARLGLTCIEPQVADGLDPANMPEQRFDVVLLDAPCSGLGILRSKPDIKYHRNPTDQQDLEALQAQLMDIAARGVKAGGRLVYSTCTLNPAENEQQVDAFFSRHPEFILVDLEKDLPFLPECDRLWRGHLTLFPQADGRDGFFAAAMERRQ